MRKLLMSLFLLGMISVYSVAIEGYVVYNSEHRCDLFLADQPRDYAEIGIKEGEKVRVYLTEPETGDFLWECVTPSSFINRFGSGRYTEIQTSPGSKGRSAVYRITDKDGFVLTLAVFVY